MIQSLVDIAKIAGKILKDGFYSQKDVKHKGQIDLVTQFDLKVEECIKDLLKKEFPEYELVAEESSDGYGKKSKKIYIDPIDGTTNFVHSFAFCAISIAIYENDTPLAGVVYNPILDQLFYAQKGCGAYLNNQSISVSQNNKMINSLFATGFPYILSEDKKLRDIVMNQISNVLANSQGVRRAGSAAIDLAYVAMGVFDGYWEANLSPWDLGAGILLVQEAGGKVTGLDGEKFDVESKRTIVASNSFVHQELLNAIL